MKIKELTPDKKKLTLIIKIEEKTEPKEVISKIDNKFHDVCEALVGDETGCVFLSLWNENINEIEKGKYYKITNVYTNLYKHSLRLNIGNKGQIQETNAEFEINTNNNLSLEEF